MNISPKSKLLIFDLYGISSMKHFIVSKDKKIVGKVLNGLELEDQKNNKLTLRKLKFSLSGYKNLSNKEIHKLSGTVQISFT